jgi:hypothetical protein
MKRNIFSKIPFLLPFLILNISFIKAQVVSIDPIFFNGDSDITVTFDATQGNGGLMGEAQVFMHAGVVTDVDGSLVGKEAAKILNLFSSHS